MMKRAFGLGVLVLPVLLVAACKEHPGTGLVADGGVVMMPAVDAAATGTVDINSCVGCTVAAQPGWTFQGVFRDDKCTIPLVEYDLTACVPVPAPGPASVTFTDRFGAHAANAVANVTTTEQIPPETPRFRHAPEGCVRANEVATAITPMGCAGQRVCRDATGALTCTNCRTLGGGCPDFQETRTYAAIQDTATPGAPKNANLEKLRQCCNALAAQGKSLGASPEGMTLISYAAQCNVLVTQAGPNGNAPELGPLRQYLQAGNVPAVCKGL